jgi:ribosomal protein S19
MKTHLIFKKNIYINVKDLNKKFLIYNGKDFQKLIIYKEMIGYRFGEFVSTSKVVMFKNKK